MTSIFARTAAVSALALALAGCTTVLPWDQPVPPPETVMGGEREQPRLSEHEAALPHRVQLGEMPPAPAPVPPQVSTPPQPAPPRAPSPPPAPQAMAPARVAPAPVAPPARPPSFGDWYAGKGSPRVLVLVDRAFLPEEAEFQADTRSVTERSGNAAYQSRDRGEVFAENSQREVSQVERRVANAQQLSEREAMTLQQAFVRPLQVEGVRLVDPSTATRLQQLRDSETRQWPSRRDPQNTETQAFVNQADWLIELLATRNPPNDPQQYSLMARVIDLRSGGLMYTITSDRIVHPVMIPGSGRPPAPVPLDATANALAERLIDELPLAQP
jgi:hypothetical protein